MKNLKKVIALVAVLALTLSTVALGATYSDVADDSAYSVAVESLSKLGIVTGYEDGTYGPEKAVTRAEMAALIARIQGYEESAKANANTAFTDVPSEYWASGYIAQAANQGIVNGYGDGTFGPDDTVKYEQAVTMLMRTLGYDPFAANNGGYPTGYLAAAQRYGVTKNVSNAVAGTDANRGTIAQLLYNGIDTAIMAQSKWGSDGKIEYTIYDGSDYYTPYKTLMSENLGVVKLKGTITKTPYSSTTGTVTINNSERAKVSMTIFDNYDTTNKDFDYSDTAMNNGTVKKDLLVGDSDVCDFLGYRVIAYVVESDNYAGEYEVLSAAKDSATNDEISFTLDKYDSLKDGKLEYFKNDTDRNTTKLNLQDKENTRVVFNNVGGKYAYNVFGSLVQKDMTAGGMVTLIDNDSTDGYDVIFVEVGSTAVVDEVNKTKVTFKEAAAMPQGASLSSIDVDDEDDSEAFFFFKDGEEIAVTDLKEWDVLTIIAEDKNASYIVAEVIGAPVTGTVSATTSSDTSEGGTAYKIEGTTYDVAANAYGVSGLEVGDAGIFYIDKYGKIAAFDEDSSVAGSAGNYAYVLKTSFDKDDFDEYTMQFKLVTANGVDTYELANKVTVNGIASVTDPATSVTASKKVTKTTNKLDGTTEAAMKTWAGSFKDLLIKYTANSSGEITGITLPGYDDDKFSAEKSGVKANSDDTKFDLDLMRIGKQNIDEDATLFLIDTTSDSDCMVGTVADLDDGQSYDSYYAFLDSKGDDANIIVVTGYKAAATSSAAAVLASVGRGQNSDLEDVYVLDYYINGELKEGVLSNSDVYTQNSTLSEGDIVLLKVSSAGVVTGINVLVDFNKNIRTATTVDVASAKGTLSNGTYKYTNGDLVTVFGYATDYSKGSKTAVFGNDSYKLSNAKNVYVIDPALKNNKVDTGSVGDYVYDADLMADPTANIVTLYEGDDKNGIKLTASNAATYYEKWADYLFVREYDGKVEDVVIVKAMSDDYSAEYVVNNALNTAKAAYDAAADAEAAAKAAYDAALAAYNAAGADKAVEQPKVVAAAGAWVTAANDLKAKATALKAAGGADHVSAAQTVVDTATGAKSDADALPKA